VILLEQDSL